MDSSLTSPQKTKSRKMKKLTKKPRVHIILDQFSRAIEIIVVVVTLAKLSYQLVNMFEDYGIAEFILANRKLAFAVGNAIVIALMANSGLLLNQEHDTKCKSIDIYDEFVLESSRKDTTSRAENVEKVKKSATEKKTKQSKSKKMTEENISEKKEKHSIVEHEDITEEKMEKQSLSEKRQSQSYRRSWSENLDGLEKKSSCAMLRRSETDASSERFDSDDELRYKIESFIARQRRNQNDD